MGVDSEGESGIMGPGTDARKGKESKNAKRHDRDRSLGALLR